MAISTVSFTNTPQAVDDYYTATQTGLTENSTETIILAVMANDLGGKAKTLYSLDDGIENEGSATSADLLMKDLVGVNNLSQYGAHIAIMADGTVAYTMTDTSRTHFASLGAGEIGYDSFTYAIRLGNGTLSWATATVEIRGVNDAPTAADGSASTDEDTPILTGSLPAASDIEGDTVTYTLGSTSPSNGTVVVYADGTFDYTPNANFNGEDSFSFVVDDGNGGSNEYNYSLTINAVNDAPTAADGSASTDEDTPILTGSLPAASDIEGDTVTYTLGSTSPSNGTVVVYADGTFDYTPNANFNGEDNFSFVVDDGNGGSNEYNYSLTINAVNDAP
ncbi:cadherin-like domain-containing protein, partial [Pseudomonas sp. NPDC077649]|uniref:cadherin-like domain-containing protein n=1 Tax=Pseudomonas sp. NPDC077649 TaxID=3364423 RepID=UPI0037C96589